MPYYEAMNLLCILFKLRFESKDLEALLQYKKEFLDSKTACGADLEDPYTLLNQYIIFEHLEVQEKGRDVFMNELADLAEALVA